MRKVLLSFSWGVANTAGDPSTAALHELSVTKLIDKASPNLMLACATGRRAAQVTLVLNRPGAPAGTPFMQYRLRDAVVTSVSHSGSGSDRPLEKVTFQYVTTDVHDGRRRDRRGAVQQRPVLSRDPSGPRRFRRRGPTIRVVYSVVARRMRGVETAVAGTSSMATAPVMTLLRGRA